MTESLAITVSLATTLALAMARSRRSVDNIPARSPIKTDSSRICLRLMGTFSTGGVIEVKHETLWRALRTTGPRIMGCLGDPPAEEARCRQLELPK